MTPGQSAAFGFAVGAIGALGLGVVIYTAAKGTLPTATRAAIREQVPSIIRTVDTAQSPELSALARTLTIPAMQEQIAQLIVNIANRSLP